MLYKKKRVSIYYCDVCGQEYGTIKPIGACKHEICGLCAYYTNRGFCTHSNSTDTCADRDGDAVCDINCFEAIEEK